MAFTPEELSAAYRAYSGAQQQAQPAGGISVDEYLGTAAPRLEVDQQASAFSPEELSQWYRRYQSAGDSAQPEGWVEYLNNMGAAGMKGVPWGQKISARATAAESYLHEALSGRDDPRSFGERYDANLGQFRQQGAEFAEEHPIANVAAQVAAGSVLNPLFKGAGLLRQSATGGGLGIAFGLAEESGDSLYNTAVGGTLGLALPPVVTGAGKVAGFLAKTGPVQRAYDNLLRPTGEAGAIFPTSARQHLPHLTPGEAALAKYSQQVPRETLEEGIHAMRQADQAGIPMAVPEATDSPTLLQLNRYVASNDQTDIARRFIEQRKDGTVARLTQELDTLSPERNVAEGLGALRDAASDRVEQTVARRTSKAEPYYQAAEKARPIIDLPEVQEVMTSKDVAPFISKLKERFPSEYGHLPDNHFRLVDQAKQHLDGLIRKEMGPGGNRNEARLLRQMVGKLKDVEKLPEYADARAAFQRHSRLVNKLVGGLDPHTGKQVKGLVSRLLSVDEGADMTRIGRELMTKRPEQLRDIRRIFGQRYQPNLEAGVRAHLQHIAESKKHGPTAVIDFVLSEDGGRKIAAAVGQERHQELARLMRMERQVQKGNNASYSGSQTQPLQEVGKRIGVVRKIIAKVFSNPAGAAGDLADAMVQDAGRLDQRVMRELAEILSEPARGREALYNVHQYRSVIDPRLERADALVEALTSQVQPGSAGAGRGLIPDAPTGESPQQQPTRPPQQQSSLSGTGNKLAMTLLGGTPFLPTEASATPMELEAPKPDRLIQAVMSVESAGKPDAVSPKGAQGLMQLMPETGKEWFKKLGLPGKYDPFDPEQNVTIGSAYLNHLSERYDGDERLALAAYNWGMGNLDKAIKKAGTSDFDDLRFYLPRETSNYVRRVLDRA